MSRALRLLGMGLCVLPPAVATLEFFPLWMTREDCRISAIAVVLLLLSALPLLRMLRARLRSPSAWLVWLILWVALSLFEPIVASLRTIALISFPTGLLGALCFRLAKRKESEEK